MLPGPASISTPAPPPAAAIEALYDNHIHALHAFALSLTRSQPDTKDLLQDLFLRLARQPSLLDGVRDPRAFLLRLVHHAAIDLFRRRQTRARHTEPLHETPPPAFAPSADPDEQAFRHALAEALDELPADQRAVVHLKLWEGMTFDAIAQLLEIPLNTAASRYRYGVDKLRDRLRPLYRELQ